MGELKVSREVTGTGHTGEVTAGSWSLEVVFASVMSFVSAGGVGGSHRGARGGFCLSSGGFGPAHCPRTQRPRRPQQEVRIPPTQLLTWQCER